MGYSKIEESNDYKKDYKFDRVEKHIDCLIRDLVKKRFKFIPEKNTKLIHFDEQQINFDCSMLMNKKSVKIIPKLHSHEKPFNDSETTPE